MVPFKNLTRRLYIRELYTWIVAQDVHSYAICIHSGFMLLTRTTVPLTDTNLPARSM